MHGILVLERQLLFGKTFLYSPEVTGSPDVLSALIPEVQELAERGKSIFYRLELLVDAESTEAAAWKTELARYGLIKAFEAIQPEDRQIIFLGQGTEAVMSQMKPKGRYNIHVAQKFGVHVRKASPDSLEQDVKIFHLLLTQTAERQKFSIRPESYFLQLCQRLYSFNFGRLFVAEYKGQPLAAAIITLYDRYASYLYGASSPQERHVMAPFALHWEAMRFAMEQGAEWYDLLAIRPPHLTKGKHKYDGITQFKQRFGGDAIHLLGGWDLPTHKGWYSLFKLIERIRR
jgi:lipid II:glycine glycyltransferase (peptidoglycan interpeptide bridge formation enzyme)